MNNETFGTYGLPGWADRLARFCRHLPNNWLGRRLAFTLRKAVLPVAGDCVDCTIDGLKLRLFPRGNLSDKRLLCTPAMLDGPERRFFARRLPAGGALVDAGANIGGYSLLLGRARPDLYFVAIEADKDLSERLQTNIDFSGMSAQVRVVNCAVTENDGPVTLCRDQENAGKNTVTESVSGQSQDSDITVPGYSLLSLLDRHTIERPAALKLDIEGHELAVLRGFFATAPERRWPEFIQLEQPRGPLCSEVVNLVREQGYVSCLRTRMNVIFVREPETANVD